MTDRFFTLSDTERREVLGTAAERSDWEAHLLEKDVWVVFALDALFRSPLRDRLVFKGGTSLSKVYGAIDRFSEDVDVTYDIREIADDLVARAGSVIPPNVSQKKKWKEAIEDRLPGRLAEEVLPILRAALGRDIPARLRMEGADIYIDYDPLFVGSGYVEPRVLLEFGAKSTGEPCEERAVVCEAAAHHPGVSFQAPAG